MLVEMVAQIYNADSLYFAHVFYTSARYEPQAQTFSSRNFIRLLEKLSIDHVTLT